MAIDTTVTLKRLIAEFSIWATAHPMVNDFGYGQYLETFRSSDNKYLAVIVNNPTDTSENFFINYQWEVICLDYVLDQKDNQQRVLSDTKDVLRDLENTVRYSKRWKEFSRSEVTWSSRRVDEFGADKCFGWITTFTLKVKKKHGICDIKSLMPTYDFEMGQVVYPTCDPVSFAINGTDEDSFASGAEFDLTLVDTNGNTPAYTYNDVMKKLTVPASSACDPVTSTFNTDPLVSTPAGGNKDVIARNSADDPIGFVAVDDENNLRINVGNSEVEIINSDGSYDEVVSVVAEGPGVHNLPDIQVTQSDGSIAAFPAMVNVVCTPMIPSGMPVKTGQVTSITISGNDDGGTQFGDGVDFYTLSHDNPFGHPRAFTGITGGYHNGTNWVDVNGNITTEALAFPDDVVCNWKQWNPVTKKFLMWQKVREAATSWTNTMNIASPFTFAGYSNWYAPNKNQFDPMMNCELAQAFDYPPFNIQVTTAGNNIWLSTYAPNAPTLALAFNGVLIYQARTLATNCQRLYVRIANESDII